METSFEFQATFLLGNTKVAEKPNSAEKKMQRQMHSLNILDSERLHDGMCHVVIKVEDIFKPVRLFDGFYKFILVTKLILDTPRKKFGFQHEH